AHDHADALDGVVLVAAEVPPRVERLHGAGLVARAAEELELAPRRVPLEPPPAPGERADRWVESGLVPAPPAVPAHVDARDGTEPRPGAPAEHDRPGLDVAGSRHEVRDAGRDHQAPRKQARDRLPRLVGRAPHPIATGLLVA